ncbi:MAG: amidohydrolase family protein [Chloroflexi bacterium]|nr:amidohydrolase family protein [Chloroflexota bacterium]
MTPEEIGAMVPGALSLNPGTYDARVRLRDMDAMGIDQALLLPTLFNEYLPLVEDAEAACALARAYNAWIERFAAVASQRLFAAATLPLQDVNLAVEVAANIAAAEFVAVVVRPVFTAGRFTTDAYFDSLWSLLEDREIAVVVHPSPGTAAGLRDANAPWVEKVSANLDLGHPVAEFITPGMDNGAFAVAMMASGLLERFPKLRIIFAHAGIAWVPIALEKASTYLWLSHQQTPVSLTPERVFFARSTAVTFRAGDAALHSASDVFARVGVFGSRYAAHDAADAWEAIAGLEQAGIDEELIADLMGNNARRILSIERQNSTDSHRGAVVKE